MTPTKIWLVILGGVLWCAFLVKVMPYANASASYWSGQRTYNVRVVP